MHQIYIDGHLYKTCATAEDATELRAGLRRWASTSTRIETRPVEPPAAEMTTPVAADPPVPCPLCGGTGEHRHLGFRKGAWVPIAEPCPRCRPPLPPAASLAAA